MNLSYQEMVGLASAGLEAAGIGEKAAFETAQFLALAELDGLASHGLARVAQYAGHAKNNRVELAPKIKVRPFKTSAALVDAVMALHFQHYALQRIYRLIWLPKLALAWWQLQIAITLEWPAILQKQQRERGISLSCLVIRLLLCRW